MNKKVDQGLKNLANWLNAYETCLSITKNEVVLFNSARKQTDVRLKLKLTGEKLHPTKSLRYVGI